jgi:hypothetical protein
LRQSSRAVVARHTDRAAASRSRLPSTRPSAAYEAAKGPRLCLDEAHHNFHTLDDRFWAFGELARRDGFRVAPSRETITAAALAKCDLFVISNAQ